MALATETAEGLLAALKLPPRQEARIVRRFEGEPAALMDALRYRRHLQGLYGQPRPHLDALWACLVSHGYGRHEGAEIVREALGVGEGPEPWGPRHLTMLSKKECRQAERVIDRRNGCEPEESGLTVDDAWAQLSG